MFWACKHSRAEAIPWKKNRARSRPMPWGCSAKTCLREGDDPATYSMMM